MAATEDMGADEPDMQVLPDMPIDVDSGPPSCDSIAHECDPVGNCVGTVEDYVCSCPADYVLAEDGRDCLYDIAALSGLGTTAGTLSPTFSPATTMYSLGAAPWLPALELRPEVAEPTLTTITVAGSVVESGALSDPLLLSSTPTPNTIELEAESGRAGTVTVVVSQSAMETYVKASNTNAFDEFGSAVALSADGTTLAVGARSEDSAATSIGGNQRDDSALDSGAVYVFARDSDGQWSQEAYVKPANSGAGDSFGFSLALSADGNTLAVGAPDESTDSPGVDGTRNDAIDHSGAVYLFRRSAGGTWSEQTFFKASNPDAFDLFGVSVALSGDGSTLAVGARLEDSSAVGIDGDQSDNSADGSGAVYVFGLAGGVWSQQAYVKASNSGASDRFGEAVALSADGDVLAVGAESEDSSTSGVGSDSTDDSLPQSGAVYLFARAPDLTWAQEAYVKASNPGLTDHFGASVALSGDGSTLAVGADGEASSSPGIDGDQSSDAALDSGAVYVFVRSAGAWSQQAYIKASNPDIEDYFGWAVALSDDGTTLAVGAFGEDSSATGIGGDEADDTASSSGAVYVFVDDGTAWTQRAYVKPSNTAASDRFGRCVALSSEEADLAVAAWGEDSAVAGIGGDGTNNTALNSGAVYVFR